MNHFQIVQRSNQIKQSHIFSANSSEAMVNQFINLNYIENDKGTDEKSCLMTDELCLSQKWSLSAASRTILSVSHPENLMRGLYEEELSVLLPSRHKLLLPPL